MIYQENTPNKDKDFSIVLGGPLYKFYLFSRLATPPLNLCIRRVVIVTMFAWLPLFILAIINGVAFSGVNVPFIMDLDVHARLIGSLSLLVFAEVIVHDKIRKVVAQFVVRDVVSGDSKRKFDGYLASAVRLRNSFVIETLLFIFAMCIGHWLWQRYTSLDIPTWYTELVDGKDRLTLAGYWYIFISLPVFQFILLRWYFRIFVWYRLLWQIARLPLRLNSLHPDRAGGIGFLMDSIYAFIPVLLAHTVLLVGIIINRIWHESATLYDFKLEIIGIIIFLLFLVLLPLFFFVFQLAHTRLKGTTEYGALASNYVNQFYAKWIKNPASDNANLLGINDIQSLADLSNSYAVSREMSLVPFNMRMVFQTVLIISLPLIPLIITMVPIAEVIKRLLEIMM